MPTVTVDSDAYQDLDAIRQRVQYRGTDLFDDNAQLRFDELLVRLEREARGIFETLWGDQTPLEETDRVDEFRPGYDAATKLVYPIQTISTVEYKTTLGADYEELDADRYDATDHHLVLSRRPSTNTLLHRRRGNRLGATATRATWRDLAEKLRVTYDRGFTGGAPDDIKSVQIQLINHMLRDLRREQTVSGVTPDQLAEMTDRQAIVTDEIRDRISDVTSPGRATHSI